MKHTMFACDEILLDELKGYLISNSNLYNRVRGAFEDLYEHYQFETQLWNKIHDLEAKGKNRT